MWRFLVLVCLNQNQLTFSWKVADRPPRGKPQIQFERQNMDSSQKNDLEHRVRQLEDKGSIRELAVHYGTCVDHRDGEGLRLILTDDIRFYFKNGGLDLNGADEAIDFFTNQLSEVSKRSLHVQHGHTVDLDANDPDRATGVQFGHSEGVSQDPELGVRLAAVRYDDVYRRVEEQWRISERCVSFFYQVLASNYLQDVASNTPVRGATSLPADL
jgi:hypothetical protein